MSLAALLGIGLALNAVASVLAFRRRSVDAGGAIAGTIVATLIFGFGGPLYWVILMTFFVTSTAAGMVRRTEKEWLSTIHQKGERRDALQVLANGGIGAVTAVLFHVSGEPSWAAAFAVSFAASNADTWASEIGVLSRTAPVSPLTFRPVARGISGGVTVLGTAASLAGALLIALVFGLENLSLHALPGSFLGVAALVTACGFGGSLVDSILGATVQARYASGSVPGAITERRSDGSGPPNRLVHGAAWITNDVVNVTSGLVAAAAAFFLS